MASLTVQNLELRKRLSEVIYENNSLAQQSQHFGQQAAQLQQTVEGLREQLARSEQQAAALA